MLFRSPNVMDLILGHKIDLVIDTPTQGNGDKTRDGFLIRRNAIETGVYCITAMDTANALAHALETHQLLEGHIDMLPAVFRTEEREKEVLFSNLLETLVQSMETELPPCDTQRQDSQRFLLN